MTLPTPSSCRHCGIERRGHCHKIASRRGVDFFLQAQQPDGTWEEASSFIGDLTEAEKRLARRRETRPKVTWRIVQRTTTVTLAALPDCLTCGHFRCDSTGPCGALHDAWERCTCQGGTRPQETTP